MCGGMSMKDCVKVIKKHIKNGVIRITKKNEFEIKVVFNRLLDMIANEEITIEELNKELGGE